MTIDFPEFIRPPRLSTDGGILLGIRLLKSKPADLDVNEKRALRGVRLGERARRRALRGRRCGPRDAARRQGARAAPA
ncbi:MAG: hypothetical protein RLO52_34195 [Sandaracinaceae bacterium]